MRREGESQVGREGEGARSGGERMREPGRATAAAELGFGVGGENDRREKGERAAAPLTAVASDLAVNATVAGQNRPTSAQNHQTRAQVSKLPGIRSYGVNCTRFCTWGLKLDERNS